MKLLEPTTLGPYALKNHMVMAAMTRSRADTSGVVGPLTVEYYAQRASAGLIISEAINISPDAIGSPLTPGLYTAEQIAAWKQVTDAVHAKGGLIYAQLWAHGPGLAFGGTGWQTALGTVCRENRRHAALHVTGSEGFRSAPRHDGGRNPPDDCRLRHCRQQRHARRLRRRGASCRQWLPAPAVPVGFRQPAHGRVRRQHCQQGPLHAGSYARDHRCRRR